jgi:hypothetical protein
MSRRPHHTRSAAEQHTQHVCHGHVHHLVACVDRRVPSRFGSGRVLVVTPKATHSVPLWSALVAHWRQTRHDCTNCDAIHSTIESHTTPSTSHDACRHERTSQGVHRDGGAPRAPRHRHCIRTSVPTDTVHCALVPQMRMRRPWWMPRRMRHDGGGSNESVHHGVVWAAISYAA